MGGVYSDESGLQLTPEEEQAVGIVPDALYQGSLASEAAHMRRRQEREKDSSVFADQSAEKTLEDQAVNEERVWLNAIGEEPKSSSLRIQYANYLSSLERYDEAAFQFTEAIGLEPRSVLAHYDFAFMRHHQFYVYFARNEVSRAMQCSRQAVEYYHKVLLIEENDIETHYQLALLYLTQLETCLPCAIDDIHSAVSSIAQQYALANCEDPKKSVYRGKFSPWFDERLELIDLCRRHVVITLDYVTEYDPVAFGTHITLARLCFLRCMPPLSYSLSTPDEYLAASQQVLGEGISSLHKALAMNNDDASVHHDMGLLLSHDSIHRFEDAEYHWRLAHEYEPGNYLYLSQLGFLYQYKLRKPRLAMECYEAALKIHPSHHQCWNNLGILRAQSGPQSRDEVLHSAQCWERTLNVHANHPEAHQNLGNVLWLHLSDLSRAEIHLQRSIAILQALRTALQKDLRLLRGKMEKMAAQMSQRRSGSNITKRDEIRQYLDRKEQRQGESEIRFCEVVSKKVSKLIAQCQSDYGGLLLMMFGHEDEAFRELDGALSLDDDCISAHYYLGKLLFEKRKRREDWLKARQHLVTYLEKENLANLVNKGHAEQLIGDICRLLSEFTRGESHFMRALEYVSPQLPQNCPTLAKDHAVSQTDQRIDEVTGETVAVDMGKSQVVSSDESWRQRLPLPLWALLKMHVGLADCIVLSAMEQIRNEPEDSRSIDEVTLDKRTVSRMDIAKQHYRVSLKYSESSSRAHLGMGRVFAYFLRKPRRAEYHFQRTIELSKAMIERFKEERAAEQEKEAKEEAESSSMVVVDWAAQTVDCSTVESLVRSAEELEVLQDALNNGVYARIELSKLIMGDFKESRAQKDCVRLLTEALTIDRCHLPAMLSLSLILWKLKRRESGSQSAVYCVWLAQRLQSKQGVSKKGASFEKDLSVSERALFQDILTQTRLTAQDLDLHTSLTDQDFAAKLDSFLSTL